MALAVGALIFLALGAKGDSSSPAVSASPATPASPVIPAPFVIPAKAGIQTPPAVLAESAIHRGARVVLDSRFRGNDKLGEWKRAELRRLLGEWEKRAGVAVGDAAVSRFGFVKRARVDFQTSLGGRKGQFAIDTIGGLRERGDDVIGWHLRGYAGEENARGGNAGLFWRVVKGESLLGANAFLDYERDDVAGGFWRWSFGAEWKNKYGELSANRYWAITDGKQQGDGYYYTREGFDADLYLRAPGLEWAALRGGYYRWEGERGDRDDEGFRYGLRLSPGGGVYLEAEYDEDSGDFGGSFSYSHTFGEASAGAERADGFNPRLHFYDSVRREYSQRISRAGGGVSQFAAVLVTSDLDVNIGIAGFTATAFSRTMTARIDYAFPLTSDVSITTGATGNEAFFRQQGGGWNLTLNATSTVAILQTARVLNVIAGGGEFERFGNNRLQTVIMPGVTLRLLGTRFSWGVGGSGTTMTLHEGTVSVVGASEPFTISTVDGARAMLADLGIGFASPGSFVFLTTGDNATVGNVAVGGGYGTRTTAILGSPAGGFAIDANGVLFFTDAENASVFTVTVTANDSHDNTDGVSLTVFVTLVTGIALPPPSGDVLRVKTLTDEGVLAQFSASGGTGIRYGLLNAPASPTFAINANNGELSFSVNPHLPVTVSVTVTASGQPPVGQRQAATAAVTLEIVDPPTLRLGFVGAANLSQLTTTAAVTAGTLSLSGGAAEGTRTTAIVGDANGFSLGGGSVLIRASDNENELTVTVFVRGDDSHDNTTPATATVVFELIGGVNLPAPSDALSVTTRVAAAAPLVTLSASGGGDTPNYRYGFLNAPTNVTVAIGNEDGKLTLSSPPHNPITVALMATASGVNSGGQTQTATALLTLIAADPPSLTAGFVGTPRFSLVAGAGNFQFTLTASGGYGNYQFAVIGVPPSAPAGINLPTVAAFNQNAANAFTNSIIVQTRDGHANTPHLTSTITLSHLPQLRMPPPETDILTVTARTNYNPLADFDAANGTQIRYGLLNTTASPTFAINANSGELNFSGNPHAPVTVSVTVTASAQNTLGESRTVTAALTLAVAGRIYLPAPEDALSVTTRVAAAAAIVTLSASGGGGTPNYRYGFLNAPANVTFAIGNDGKLTLSSPPHNPITVTLTATASGDNPAGTNQTATALLTLIAADPPPITIGFVGTPQFTLMAGGGNALFTLTASGGHGDYQFNILAPSPPHTFLNTVLLVFDQRIAVTLSVIVQARDAHQNTENALLTITIHFRSGGLGKADTLKQCADDNICGGKWNANPLQFAGLFSLQLSGTVTGHIRAASRRPKIRAGADARYRQPRYTAGAV